mmetsp:Transcript_34023/g.79678  ORF Transcript_34023/g.79678 Transcript_34023/m.79678 type:complete len:201 (-) Transcript_34023:39-641(-)
MCKEGVEKTEDAPHKASHAGMVGGVDADLARTQHTAVYHRVSALLGQYVDGMGDRGKKVIKFASPAEILEVFGSVCADDGGAERERGASADEVVRLCELVLDYSVRTSSPLFFNQLYGRVDPVGLAADHVLSTLNTNAFTWEVCRPFPPKTCFRPCRLPKYCQRVGVEKGDAAAWTEHARENQRTACRFRRKGDSPFGGT